jgi:thiamine-monophosphate kinase
LNEIELIDYLTEGFPIRHQNVVKGIGDDCSVWKEGDEYRVFTTDSMVEGDHFLKEWFTPEEIGMRAVETNLSDIASMGAKPTFMYVSLIIDDRTSPEWLNLLYKGIRAKCEEHQLTLMGGNVTHGKTLSITIGVQGDSKAMPVYRNGAKEGDLVVVTGTIGDACVARMVLNKKKQIPDALKDRLAHPRARLREAEVIAKFASAMIDISDGIASEARHIATQSKLGVVIDADSIPTRSQVKELALIAGIDVLEAQMRGGEDYELMFTISPANFKELVKVYHLHTTLGITTIGKMVADKKYVYLKGKEEFELPKGFDHFSSNINL